MNRNFLLYSSDKFMMERLFLKVCRYKVFSAFPCDGYFIDIGIPEDYEKANKKAYKAGMKNKRLLFVTTTKLFTANG